MCIYRYCYFGGCKHQKLVLMRFCDKAKKQNSRRELAAFSTYLPIPSPITEEGTPKHENWKEQTGPDGSSGDGNEQGRKSPAQDDDNHNHAHNSDDTTPKPPTIVPDSQPDISHSSTASHPTMPLSSFSNDFRHWAERFIAPNDASAECKDTDTSVTFPTSPSGSSVTIRASGIRNNTDESFDLPSGSDIIQHIAESSQCISLGQNGNIEGRCASSGSVEFNFLEAEEAEHKLELSLIEADIDFMKEEVARLRAESDKSRVAPKTEEERQLDHYLETRSNRAPTPDPVPVDTTHPSTDVESRAESSAALLKSLHETSKAKDQPVVVKRKSPPKPRLDDLAAFPTLGKAENTSLAAPGEQDDKRKISWSETCTKGLQSNVKAVSMRTGKSLAYVNPPAALQTAPITQLGAQPVKDTNSRELDGPAKKNSKSTRRRKNVPSVQNTDPPAESRRNSIRHNARLDTVAKQSNGAGTTPGFAQPTKSFARRAGELVQNEIKQDENKSSTTRATQPEVEKNVVKNEQKRPPIPRGWGPLPVAADAKHRPNDHQLSPGQWPSIKDAVKPLKMNDPLPPDDIPAPSAQLGKKLSTYMSPTIAASQRVADTLGKSFVEPRAPRQKPSLRIDVVKASAYKPRSPDSSNDSGLGLKTYTPGPALTPKSAHASPKLSSTSDLQSDSNGSAVQDQDDEGGSPNNSNRSHSPSKIPRPSKRLIELPHTETTFPLFDSNINSSAIGTSTSEPMPMTRRRTVSTRILQPVLQKLDRAASLQNGDSNDSNTTLETTTETQVEVSQPSGDASVSIDTSGRNLSNGSDSRKASSLRATAQEFKPMFEPKTQSQALGLLSWRGDLDRYPQEEWRHMPSVVRYSIQTLREFKRNASPSKTAERRFWGTLMKSEVATDSAENARKATQSEASKGTPMITTVSSPGKGSVKWALEDSDGKQQHLSFGRAPALVSADVPALYNGSESPTISPTSDATSVTTPQSGGPWTIDAGLGRGQQHVGWKGGDGKEITFKGYAPFVERDPNNAVQMRNRDREGSSPHVWKKYSTPSSHSQRTPRSQSARVWPRSRRQWAEMAESIPKPCGDIVVEQAMEAYPLTMPIWGHCEDCVPSSF